MTSSIMVGYKSSGLYMMKPYPKSQALSRNPISRLSLSNFKDQNVFLGNKTRVQSNINTKRNSFTVSANSLPEVPTPSGPPSNHIGWILGFVVSFVLPFFTSKLGPLVVLKNRIMNAVQSVEDIVEAVEKVAEKVDEIAEDVGDDLPQGKLKDLVHLVENVAEKTAKTADCIDNVIDKVQEVEDQVDDMIVESQAKTKKTQNAPKEAQEQDH